MAKKIYVGAPTEVPIYETQVTEADITTSNMLTYFTRSSGDYYFVGSGSTWTTNNGGVDSSTAQTTLTAKMNMEVSFDYSYSSEANYDKFTLTIAGNVIEDAVSGTTTTKSYTGTISQGQTIDFKYTKDSSSNINDDKCTFSNMHVKCFKQTQTGVETKSLARKVKKVYIGVPTDVPIYENQDVNIDVTAGNIAEYFAVQNGSHYFAGSGSTFTTNNGGVVSSTAQTTLTALSNMNISFSYSYASEANWDKFTLVVAGETIEDAVSGTETTKSYTGTLSKGQTIDFKYIKDGSGDQNGDKCTFFNLRITNIDVQIDVENKPIAQKIKKVYIGVGGVARPCFSGGELAYYGTITPVSYVTRPSPSTTVGNYALVGWFGGPETYDKSLTKSWRQVGTAGEYRQGGAATTIGNYAIFSGGTNGSDNYNLPVYYCNDALTFSYKTTVYRKRQDLAATSTRNHAFFGGGRMATDDYEGIVTTYDSSLTIKFIGDNGVNQLTSREYLSAATAGYQYALFGGGDTGNGTGSSYMQGYDDSLTKLNVSPLTSYHSQDCAITAGEYALFIGRNTTECYDKSLTQTILSPISQARYRMAGVYLDGYSIVAGGSTSGVSPCYNTVDVYDSSLTHTVFEPLSEARTYPIGVSVGGYALFAGGKKESYTNVYTVDVYTVV